MSTPFWEKFWIIFGWKVPFFIKGFVGSGCLFILTPMHFDGWRGMATDGSDPITMRTRMPMILIILSDKKELLTPT